MPKAKPKTDAIVGRRIVEVRPMTRAEMEAEGWGFSAYHGPPVALVLDDGTRLYPSRDDEGNGPGALFGVTPDGESIAFHS